MTVKTYQDLVESTMSLALSQGLSRATKPRLEIKAPWYKVGQDKVASFQYVTVAWSQPSSPFEGQIWLDANPGSGTYQKFYIRSSGTWALWDFSSMTGESSYAPPGATTSNTRVFTSRDAAVGVDVSTYTWVNCLKYHEDGPFVNLWYQVIAGDLTVVTSRPTGVLNSASNANMLVWIANQARVQFSPGYHGELYAPAGTDITPKHFGAYGDVLGFNFAGAHDDSVALQAAFDYVVWKGYKLSLGPQSYRVTDTLYLGWDVDMSTATNRFSGATISGDGISSQGMSTVIYFFPTGGVSTKGMIECRNTAWANLKLEDFYCVGLTDTSSNPYSTPVGDVYPYQYGIVHIDQYFTGWTYSRANVKNARNCYAILGQSFTVNGEFTMYNRCDGTGQKFFYMGDGIGSGVGQAYGQYFMKCSFSGGFNGNASPEYVAFDVGHSAGGYNMHVEDFGGSVNTVYTNGSVTPRNYIFLRTRGVGSFHSVGGRVEGLSTLIDNQSGIGDRITMESMDFAGLFTTPAYPLIKATSTNTSVSVRIADCIVPLKAWSSTTSGMDIGLYVSVHAMDSSNYVFERCKFDLRKDMSSVSQGIKRYPISIKRSAKPFGSMRFVDCYGLPSVNGYGKYKQDSNSITASFDSDKAGHGVRTGIPYNKILKPYIVDIPQNNHQPTAVTLTITTTANTYVAACTNTANAFVGSTISASTLTGRLFVISAISANTSVTLQPLDGSTGGAGIAAGTNTTATLGVADSLIAPWVRNGSDYSLTNATRWLNSWTTGQSSDGNARTLFFVPGSGVAQVLNTVSTTADCLYVKMAIGVSTDNADDYLAVQVYNTVTGIIYDEVKLSGMLNDTTANRLGNLDYVTLTASQQAADVAGAFAIRLYAPSTNSATSTLTVQLGWLIASEKVDAVPHSYASYSPTVRTFGPTTIALTTSNGSAIATATSTANVAPGMTLSGNVNIPGGVTISTVDSATQITLSSGTSVTAGSSVSTTCTNSQWIQFQNTPKTLGIPVVVNSTYVNGHPDLPANTYITQGDTTGTWYKVSNAPTTASGPSAYTTVYLTRRDTRSWSTTPQFKAYSRFALPHKEDYSGGSSTSLTINVDLESDIYLSLGSERITYFAEQKWWQIPRVVFAAAMPTTGYWVANDYVQNTSVAVQSGSVAQTIKGWLRVTTGNANVLGTDGVADFIPTVQGDLTKYKETATSSSLTIPNNVNTWIYLGAGTTNSTTSTINFPTTPIDGQRLRLMFAVAFTSVSTASSQTIKAGLSSAAVTANTSQAWVYDLGTTTWYKE